MFLWERTLAEVLVEEDGLEYHDGNALYASDQAQPGMYAARKNKKTKIVMDDRITPQVAVIHYKHD